MADKTKCVVAIDFGTAFSGFAYAFNSKPQDIHMYGNWGASEGIEKTFKAPTCVLTKQENFVAFGYEAYSKYSHVTPEQDSRFAFFNNFKMHLYNTQTICRETKITSIDGKERIALDIFAMALGYLRECALRDIETRSAEHLKCSEVTWVVTVPAIWPDSSKHFMKEAAYKARIVEALDSNNLIICLEPEAASLYCHNIDLDVFSISRKSTGRMSVGTKYMVVDCGGGTLDVTVHELLDGNKVKELYKASGEALGGMLVNQNFEHLLSETFGEAFITRFKRRFPPKWQHMMNQFEIKKRSTDPYNPNRMSVSITFDAKFSRCYEDCMPKSLDKAFTAELKSRGISGDESQINLDFETMMELFGKATRKILDFVDRLLKEPLLKEITHILLVGGFSDSRVLQDNIKCRFGEHYKILIPSDPAQCILKGAVLFGHSPNSVVQRIARKTYGFHMSEDFDHSKHDPNKTVRHDGKKLAYPIFEKLVTVGETVDCMEVRSFDLFPVKKDLKWVTTSLYSTDAVDPRYTDDEGVTELAKVAIELPGIGTDRKIELKVTFGGTILEVKFSDTRKRGQSDSNAVDFLGEYVQQG